MVMKKGGKTNKMSGRVHVLQWQSADPKKKKSNSRDEQGGMNDEICI